MKKALSVFLSLAFILSMLAMPSAHAISDVSGDLEEKIGVLQMLGVISGFPDGTFRPGDSLTRAQFCKMAVYLMGRESEVNLYKNYTIYPDVKTSYWATGYINLSVKTLKLIKGFPDGSFRPETSITYAQAITILMRALGYTDEDVGPKWPSDYINRAAAIGLTSGLAVSANSSISRSSGAVLFYNMLNSETKGGDKFVKTIAGSIMENTIILDNDARAADGTSGAVLIDGQVNAIKTVSPMPESFTGLRGTLVLDSAGRIKAFIPAEAVRKTFVLAESVYPKLISADGAAYTLESDTPVYLNGKKETYDKVCYDLVPGTMIDILFTASGAADYVIAGSPASFSGAVVLSGTPTMSALESMLGAAAGGQIYKNGSKSTVSDLVKYDVVTYNDAAKVFTVSDFRLSGAYEYATPNTTAPTKITVLGKEFDVLPSAIAQLAKFKIGDAITLLFTNDMKVAGAVAQSELRAYAYGVYTGSAVELSNGTELSVKAEDAKGIDTGALVKVYSYTAGSLSISRVYDREVGLQIDMNKGIAGDKAIAGNAVYYEKISANGELLQIAKADIPLAAIPADRVYYVGYDTAGRANLIVLRDITGNLYEYGKVYTGVDEVDDPFADPDPVTHLRPKIRNSTIWIENSGSEIEKFLYAEYVATQGNWGGIAHDNDKRVISVITLQKYSGLTRQSFTAGNVMLLGGVRTKISENVHIYIEATGKYMTASAGKTFDQLIAEARAFGSTFEAYTDRDPAVGGQVRVLVVK